MKTTKITNFELVYDGMYAIRWEGREVRVFLELNTILKMLEIEGLDYDNINDTLNSWKDIRFSKVEIGIPLEIKNGKISYLTSEMSDNFVGLKNITMADVDLMNNKDEK